MYMRQPEGFKEKGKAHMVYRSKNSIYRSKQVSRQWYMKFDDVVTSFGFRENILDSCIYLKVSGSKFIFLVLYVDNILLASSSLGLLQCVKGLLF